MSSIKAIALAVLAVLVPRVVRVRSPALRHAVWATVLCGMLGIPFLNLTLPRMVLPLLPSAIRPCAACGPGAAPFTESSSVDATLWTAASPATVSHDECESLGRGTIETGSERVRRRPLVRATWPIVAFGGYLAGVIMFFGRFLLGLAGCRRLVQSSRRIELDRLKAGSLPPAWPCFPRVAAFESAWNADVIQGPGDDGVGASEDPPAGRLVALACIRNSRPCWRMSWRTSSGGIPCSPCSGRSTNVSTGFTRWPGWCPSGWPPSPSVRATTERLRLPRHPIPYARHLLEFAAIVVDHRHRPTMGILSMADGGDLSSRVHAILDRSRVISPPLSRRAVLLMTMTLAVLARADPGGAPCRASRILDECGPRRRYRAAPKTQQRRHSLAGNRKRRLPTRAGCSA